MARRQYDKKRPDVKFAISLGWEPCGISGSGHPQFRHPGTSVRLVITGTASDHRSMKNNISWTKRLTPREE